MNLSVHVVYARNGQVVVSPECRDDKKPHGQQRMLQQQQRDWPATCSKTHRNFVDCTNAMHQ